MTKQEKIKEEWDLLCPNSQIKICNNTGFSIVYCVNGISDLTENSIINESDIDYEFLDSDLIKFRPKSLQEIENNNGWIKIESEDDLPDNIDGLWEVVINGKQKFIELLKDNKERLYKDFLKDGITHYKITEKSQPPIY